MCYWYVGCLFGSNIFLSRPFFVLSATYFSMFTWLLLLTGGIDWFSCLRDEELRDTSMFMFASSLGEMMQGAKPADMSTEGWN